MSVPLMDLWIRNKIGIKNSDPLRREYLENYQLKMLNETLYHARKNSRFYKEKYRGLKRKLCSLEELLQVPFTTADDLRQRGQEMLCVHPDEISRIVTLDTSGSTGKPKRVYFTKEDQELTIDYFHHGMKYVVDTTDIVLILLPCARPGSVGDLLKHGLLRLGCKPIPYGFPDVSEKETLAELRQLINEKGVTSIVGSPKEVFQIAEFTASGEDKIRSVLLSTDYISDALCCQLSKLWGCKVFEHYGMTEMGLGGAVSCEALEGYHPRENDLFFEIIDPETGIPVVDGEYGEIVFTTLTRKGMPLIRYRTGDESRWITEACSCGSVLKRLEKVRPRNVKKYEYVKNNKGDIKL